MSYIEDNGYLIFDGVKSSDYGVWIKGGGTFNAPKRRYQEVIVPGRNGVLTLDEGAFEEQEVVYPAFIARNFPANVEAFRNQLMARNGYVRMTDSYHPGEFYMAKYMSGLEVETVAGGKAGSFDLTFRRDPRRFLTSGETTQTYTANGTINNPTLFASNPLIRVNGYGTLTIGAETIVITQGFDYVDIDSEIQDCYFGINNANSHVTLSNFPTLQPGTTGIVIGNGISSIEITPRWYIV